MFTQALAAYLITYVSSGTAKGLSASTNSPCASIPIKVVRGSLQILTENGSTSRASLPPPPSPLNAEEDKPPPPNAPPLNVGTPPNIGTALSPPPNPLPAILSED